MMVFGMENRIGGFRFGPDLPGVVCGLILADDISRLINDWMVGMMVIGNRKPYALERLGHSLTRTLA